MRTPGEAGGRWAQRRAGAGDAFQAGHRRRGLRAGTPPEPARGALGEARGGFLFNISLDLGLKETNLHVEKAG